MCRLLAAGVAVALLALPAGAFPKLPPGKPAPRVGVLKNQQAKPAKPKGENNQKDDGDRNQKDDGDRNQYDNGDRNQKDDGQKHQKNGR